MKINKWVDLEGVNVDIEITSEDIQLIFREEEDYANPDAQKMLMCNLNTAITFFKGIPTELAQKAASNVKEIVRRELKAAMEKFQ